MADEPYETLDHELAQSTSQARPLQEGRDVHPNEPPAPPYAAQQDKPPHPLGGPPGQTGNNPGQGGAPPPGQANKPDKEPEPEPKGAQHHGRR